MTIPSSQVNINDFEAGQVLPGDIVDDQDKVLFRQGLKLTKDILAAWQRRGTGPFFLKSSAAASEPKPPAAQSTISDSYRHAADFLQTMNDWFDLTLREYGLLVERVLADQLLTLDSLDSALDKLQDLVDTDAEGIAYWFSECENNHSKNAGLLGRSIQLTALTAVLAKQYGLSREDAWRSCQAALLHDLVLVPPILQKIQDSLETEEERQEVVARHGLFSADILNTRSSLPQLVRVVMQQIHEQMDGTGYPRGIPGHVINVMARLINIVDAYMSLISAGTNEPGFVPADAIAYMVYHTSRGAFDREGMMAFIKWQTMYGIGSLVQLDDGRQATILRAADSNPLRPIVELYDPESSDKPTLLHLNKSQANIERPVIDPRVSHRVRMTKSEMQAVLWQKLISSESGTVVTA